MRHVITKLLFYVMLIGFGVFVGTVAERQQRFYSLKPIAIYTVTFRAVDSVTKAPVNASILWSDRMDLFEKGNGMSGFTQRHEDGTQTFMIEGRRQGSPLSLKVSATGYEKSMITLDALGSGIHSRYEDKIVLLELVASRKEE